MPYRCPGETASGPNRFDSVNDNVRDLRTFASRSEQPQQWTLGSGQLAHAVELRRPRRALPQSSEYSRAEHLSGQSPALKALSCALSPARLARFIVGALRAKNPHNAPMAASSQEVIDYRRSPVLRGVQVVDAQHSPREWRVLCPDYAVVMFRTWRGRVRTRARVHVGEPGVVFCYTPGEVMVAKPEQGPGSFNVLELNADVLEEWLSEQQPSSVSLDWAEVMKPISARLRRHFSGFFELFAPAAPAMQVQSQLLELSEVMITELISGARQPRPIMGAPPRGAARMRECLNEEGLHIDLETLAKRAGLSRFQALRVFKQRYGLPPHAYQLCLRVGHARRLLQEGTPAADVASRCGFADQSHFIRHFKRLSGVTPMQYALAHTPTARRASDGRRGAKDPGAVIASSDR